MAQLQTLTNSQIEPIRFTSRVKLSTSLPGERIITLEEVSWHDNISDCWIVIYDRVYDVTDFLREHPGGHDVLLDYAGRDGTCAFRGSGHSKAACEALKEYLIGELPMTERLFRKPDGLKLIDIPK
ncbi:hypothetical protein PPYR_01922 [Photinus pyralis]|uniref:Cytochrome b5 heme-binding domain-containing protein n=1 Tax=Photinus pyralis TaxID=7054 RepID=A0A1Y1L5U7_PHOPY|nr:cytochrome b5-like [Photinus pyralis]KAB0804952.1 hypothetical protein PPYR_01922 [Photinus pyralis]